jgi:hypothetical protein
MGDSTIWDSMCREFREEVGQDIPSGLYTYSEWGDIFHSIRVYRLTLTDEDAVKLPIGRLGSDAEGVWVNVTRHNVFKYTNHIQSAMQIHNVI